MLFGLKEIACKLLDAKKNALAIKAITKNLSRFGIGDYYNTLAAQGCFCYHFTMSNGTLYIVATPIGNLSDITARALDVLRSVDLVLCEDTRVTRGLLTHYNISTPTRSYHEHTSAQATRQIINELRSGKNMALVTDAGTPGISDPGSRLVVEATRVELVNSNISVVPVPGPSAVISALSVSGFVADKFLFLGFPPHKKGRQKFWSEVARASYTVVFYESSHRIKKSLGELVLALGVGRDVCVCRELTKKFESIYRVKSEDLPNLEIITKGEFVIVVSQN